MFYGGEEVWSVGGVDLWSGGIGRHDLGQCWVVGGCGAFVWALQFFVSPVLTWVGLLCGYNIAFPALDISELMTLLFGMLGLGTLRTQEKLKGVQ